MKDWERYEKTARYLLNQFAGEFGLGKVEGKQIVAGKSGTSWEIDAKAVKLDGRVFLVVECRLRNASIDQGQVGKLAYTIHDTGGEGGIFVTPIGFQRGARKLAEYENIHHVVLDQNSTNEAYVIEFLDQIIMGFSTNVGVVDCVDLTWEP